jgi:hypothetical protein
VDGGISEIFDFGQLEEEECHNDGFMLYVQEEWGVH